MNEIPIQKFEDETGSCWIADEHIEEYPAEVEKRTWFDEKSSITPKQLKRIKKYADKLKTYSKEAYFENEVYLRAIMVGYIDELLNEYIKESEEK